MIMTEERDRVIGLRNQSFYQHLNVEYQKPMSESEKRDFCRDVLQLTKDEIEDATDRKGKFNPTMGIKNFQTKYDISPDKAMNLTDEKASQMLERNMQIRRTNREEIKQRAENDGCPRWPRRRRVGADAELLAWLMATMDAIQYISMNKDSEWRIIYSTEIMMTDVLHAGFNLDKRAMELLLSEISQVHPNKEKKNEVEQYVIDMFNAVIAGAPTINDLQPWMKTNNFKDPNGKDFQCKLTGPEHKKVRSIFHEAIDAVFEDCAAEHLHRKNLYHEVATLHDQAKERIEQRTECMTLDQIFAMGKVTESFIRKFVVLHGDGSLYIYHHELFSGHLMEQCLIFGNLFLGSQSSLELKLGMLRRYAKSKPPAGASKGGHKHIENREEDYEVEVTKSGRLEQMGALMMRQIVETMSYLEGDEKNLDEIFKHGDAELKIEAHRRYEEKKRVRDALIEQGLEEPRKKRGRPKKYGYE